jgi:hypothetical protein
MPVLIIVLSAYLFFFAVIGLIAIAEYADRRERQRQAVPRPPVSMAGFSVSQASDPLFRDFWDAQAPSLRLISDGGNSGVRIPSLRICFTVACRRFPEILDGHTLEEWVQFLEQEQLVGCHGEKVRITPQGAEFVRTYLGRRATVNH